jgi:hypothetical protein
MQITLEQPEDIARGLESKWKGSRIVHFTKQ